jgi:hypothetical protein
MSKSSPARPGTGDYSVTSKSKGRRKKQQPVYNLEEVFNQVSNVTGSDLTAPPARIVLTPRSAEACLKLGINPEILKIRDIDSFWEPGIEPAVQRMRHEAYVQRRHETMKQCRLERKRVMNSVLETSGMASSGSKGGEEMTPEMILQKQKEQSSTLIQMELARIEKMQRRQEKELEQMIQVKNNEI